MTTPDAPAPDTTVSPLHQLLTAVVTDQPAHSGTLRNRMIDLARGTAAFRSILHATENEIDAAARQLGLVQSWTTICPSVGRYGYAKPVKAWSKPPTQGATL